MKQLIAAGVIRAGVHVVEIVAKCENCSDPKASSGHPVHLPGQCKRIVYRGDWPDGWNETCGCGHVQGGERKVA